MQLSSKKSLLVIGKTRGRFFNTLTVGQKYSILNRDNLTQAIQLQLSLKGKIFSIFFPNLFDVDKTLKIFKKR